MTHAELVKRSAVWLRNHGVCVVETEVSSWCHAECPDVIGWGYHGRSTVIEVKVSRADFLKDKKKPFRGEGKGLGCYRYYAAPKGLIAADEVPACWGLLETSNAGMRLVKRPTLQPTDMGHENTLLVQMCRFMWQDDWRQKHWVDIEQGVQAEIQRLKLEAEL